MGDHEFLEESVGKDDHAYFMQRAAEELAAAELATCAAAERAHRELSLRYSLRQVLPEPHNDEARPIGQPKAPAQGPKEYRKRA